MSGGDQKLEVIRKLLAKAEKAATAEEASAYNAKAAQMMARHGVDEAMLAATGVKQDALGERRIALTDPYSQEKAQLAGLIGRALGCRAVRHPGYGRGQIIAVTIFGYESDLQRTEVLFTSLLLQATRQVVHQRPSSWTGESTAAFRRTWLTGFAIRDLPAAHRRGASGDRPARRCRSAPRAIGCAGACRPTLGGQEGVRGAVHQPAEGSQPSTIGKRLRRGRRGGPSS